MNNRRIELRQATVASTDSCSTPGVVEQYLHDLKLQGFYCTRSAI